MIIIYGYSDLAKTPIANQLAALLNFEVVSASTPIREYARKNSMANATREYLTVHTNALLRVDRFWSADELAKLVKPDCILEGVRNPIDFVKLFNPARDVVVKVVHPTQISANNFEYYGVIGIEAIIGFYTANNLMAIDRHIIVQPDLDPTLSRPPLTEAQVNFIVDRHNRK